MKKQLFLTFMMLISISNFAQKGKDIKNPNIETSGTHFENPTTERTWSNANGDSYTKAKYKAYNGITFVKINTKKDMKLLLNYDLKVEKGELEMQIIDSKGTILFQKTAEKDEIGSTELAFKSDEKYQIKFIGTDTKGSYFCQWIEQN